MKTIFSIISIILCLEGAAQLKDCSTCSENIITNNQIADLSIDEVQFLTNDLVARKGYVFHDSNIDAYYSDQSWYKPGKSNDNIEYTNTENQNLKLFLSKTKELKEKRESMITELKKFKALINSNDRDALKSRFYYTGENDWIKSVLDEVYIGDLHWSKNEGFYKVVKDNGEIVKEYILKIDGDKVSFELGIKGASDIVKEGSVYPKAYVVESSHVYLFEFKNGRLVFEKEVVAG